MIESAGPGILDVLRLGGATLLVVGLIAALGMLLRRGSRRVGGRRLAVEERLALGRGLSLVVVTDGPRRLLVGVSDKGINLVSELSPDEDRPRDAAAEVIAAPPERSFAARLAERLAARPAVRGEQA